MSVERVIIHGVTFEKSFFKNKTFQEFCEIYETQHPYNLMVPKKRMEVLQDTWKVLETPKKPNKGE